MAVACVALDAALYQSLNIEFHRSLMLATKKTVGSSK